MSEVAFSSLCSFTDKQWLATETADKHRYTLFGGARGPGKSYWLRWYCVRFLLLMAGQGFRNGRVMLASEDYPSLYERQIAKVTTEFPPWLGVYHTSRNEFRLAARFGGGTIAFRNLDDPSKYQSAEFALIAVDEVTKNPERAFHLLRGSLRWKGFTGTRFVAATNPAANWVRDYWIERRFPNELQILAPQFAFVPALPDDNPHLPQEYWQELETLTPALRKAWRYGDWYAAVEGLVYDTFSELNITDQEPEPGLPIGLAMDDGYVDPRATLFVQTLPGGDLLVFDELYQTKTLEEETINDIMERVEWLKVAKPRIAVVSHEAVALRRRLNEAGIKAVNWLNRKNPQSGSTRRAAITLTRSFICDGKQHRAIKIHRRCKHLIDELSMGYRYPEGRHGLEDTPEDGNDHACLVAGTLVTTNTGKIPIEAVAVGDQVLTRGGYKRVTASGMVRPDAEIYEVTFSDGRVLRGTRDHLVLTQNGYSRLDALRYLDIITLDENVSYSGEKQQCQAKKQPNPRLSSSMESCSGVILSRLTGQIRATTDRMLGTSKRGSKLFIERFGSLFMAPSLTGTTFTTRMEIHSTMISRILSACRAISIYRSMRTLFRLPNQESGSYGISNKLGETVTSGQRPLRAKRSCAGWHESHGTTSHCLSELARFAASSTQLHFQPDHSIALAPVEERCKTQNTHISKNGSASTADRPTKLTSTNPIDTAPVHVLRVRATGQRAAVFDLTVEDAHEYFANGVLVHNCQALETWIWYHYGGRKMAGVGK